MQPDKKRGEVVAPKAETKSSPSSSGAPGPVPPAEPRVDPAASSIAEAAAVRRRFAPAPALDPEREKDRVRLREALDGRRLADLEEDALTDAAASLRSQAIVHARAHGAVALRAHLEALLVGLPSPTT